MGWVLQTYVVVSVWQMNIVTVYKTEISSYLSFFNADEERGNLLPSGGIYMSPYILSMPFQEDVEDQLFGLPKPLYEEALSRWLNHHPQRIAQHRMLFDPCEDLDTDVRDFEDDEIDFQYDAKHHKSGIRRKDKPKRGQKRLDRHKKFDKIKKNRIYVVENL
jgi:hypothetical protein